MINMMKRVKPLPDPITQTELWELGQSIPDEQDKALFFFLYLTGSRISEALNTQTRDIYATEVILHNQKAKKAVAFNLLTLKKRSGMPRRTVLINLYGMDKQMFEVINKFRNKKVSNDSMLFDYGNISKNTKKARDRAYYKIHKLQYQIRAITNTGRPIILQDFHLFLHYLRHCRAANLTTEYGFSADELKTFFNWSSTAPAEIYVHTTPVHIFEKILNIQEGKHE